MSARLSLVCIAIATLVLAIGYLASALWALPPLLAVVGVLWGVRQHKGDARASTAGLVLGVVAAAVGLRLRVGAGWLLVGVVAALSAWDLDQFEQHLKKAGQVSGRPEMERRHLLRLALADTVGLALGVVTLLVQVRFSFLIALLLAALLALGVGELILYLRQGHRG